MGFEEPITFREQIMKLQRSGQLSLNGKCLHECIVYQANLVTNNECKEYFEIAEGEFKLRYNNHIMSFRHKKCVNDTELLKYLWKLKEENIDYNLQWSIKAYASPYK